MSTEEIIHSWKNEQPRKPKQAGEKPAGAPENPAGEQGLSDEELELVEGGSGACSCDKSSCIVDA